MVVGSMAFILKCAAFSIAIDSDWLHAIEFADLVIPITAFFFVLHGTSIYYFIFSFGLEAKLLDR